MSGANARYHHVTHNISRRNVGAARHFYGDVLGLREIEPMGDPRNERLIWFAIAEQQLHLVIRDQPDVPTSRHFAVLIDDFDSFVSRLEQHGVVMDELKPGSHWSLRPDGSKVAFCYDPDRNRIELMGSAEVK